MNRAGEDQSGQSARGRRSRLPAAVQATTGVPFLIRAMAFCIFFFPSSMVFKPIGAAGTVPMILAVVVFGLWVCRRKNGRASCRERVL